MRVDDASGGRSENDQDFSYVETANRYGFKPWVGFFLNNIDGTEAQKMKLLTDQGHMTASVHGWSDQDFFYFDNIALRNLPDAVIAENFALQDAFYSTWGITPSKLIVPHYYAIGDNVFDELAARGVEFLGQPQPVGEEYVPPTPGPKLMIGPYRKFEAPSGDDSFVNTYFADFFPIAPGHPLNGHFFDVITEIRDRPGYEWLPDVPVEDAIADGTHHLKMALDSMVLPTLFAHEYNIDPVTPADWDAIMRGITSSIASYGPEYVTLDEAARYVRAATTSNLSDAIYIADTNQLKVTFSGSADVDTRFYVFTQSADGIKQRMISAPAFSNSTTVTATLVDDSTPPVSTITDPTESQHLSGTTYLIKGTATDGAGVGLHRVEVSTDGGATWNPANGTANWSYSWTLPPVGTFVIKSRATDSMGNVETPSVGVGVTIGGGPPSAAANPLLVLVNAGSSNPFGRYLGEILRAEGFNEYQIEELGAVDGTYLSGFDTVILAETALSASQITMLTNYVNAGGNLIAMRPDPRLAGLLGLSPAGGSIAEGYLKVNTTAPPGAGIVGDTMQFHGTADRYSTLAGTTVVADLYANASTPAGSPAVTMHASGSGQAAAFTFDLARSIAYMRQGNPAWAGQERDGTSGIRASDMFDGWIDPSKMGIPQADEEQRLLANLVLQLNGAKKPLPRLWYLPDQDKALFIMTKDDDLADEAATNSDLADVESFGGKATVYVLHAVPDPAMVQSWRARGHEVAVHPDDTWEATAPTVAGMTQAIESDVSDFVARYGGAPVTVRNHWVVWVGWADQAQIEAAHGIRLDLNYYHWGGSMASVSGFFTGSGLPQKFVNQQGNIIGAYQLLTELPDETWGSTIPQVAGKFFDDAVNKGYYGAFVANFHSGRMPTQAIQTMQAAASRGVPIWSAAQFLDFTETRDGARMQNVAWADGNQLSFHLAAPASSQNLTLMLPAKDGDGDGVFAIAKNGASQPFTVQTIKGRNYALVTTSSGSFDFVVDYGTDTAAPIISNVQVTDINGTTATVGWATNEPATSKVEYGLSTALGQQVTEPDLVAQHSVQLTGLQPETAYFYRVSSTDSAGNTASSDTLTFSTSGLTWVQTSVADFQAGTATGVAISEDSGGELRLAPALQDIFTAPSLDGTRWASGAWGSGGAATLSVGTLAVDGTWVHSTGTFSAGTSLESRVRVGASAWENFGLATDLNGNSSSSWALFSTRNTSNILYARTMVDGVETVTPLTGSFVGTDHAYQIVWEASRVSYYIDGQQVASHDVSIDAPMALWLSDYNSGIAALTVDWVRVPTYVPGTGTLISAVFDAGSSFTLRTLSWQSQLPAGTGLDFETRTSTDNVTWSAWSAPITTSGSNIASPPGRYLQYRVNLTSTGPGSSPVVESLRMEYGVGAGSDQTPPVISSVAVVNPASGSANVTWTTDELATSRVDYGLTPLLGQTATDAALVAQHVLSLTGLQEGDTYYYQVTSVDAAGNTATSAIMTFHVTPPGWTQTTVADFQAGTQEGVAITDDDGDGELRLSLSFRDSFSASALDPALWTSVAWASGGKTSVSGGLLSTDGVRVGSIPQFRAPQVLEAKVRFTASPYQHIGFATDLNGGASSAWALFSTYNTTDTLYARTLVNNTEIRTPLGPFVGSDHIYRIVWQPGQVSYFIDGALVATHAVAINVPMALWLSDFNVAAPALVTDWVRAFYHSPGAGTYTSPAFDAGGTVYLRTLTWAGKTPAGTTLEFRTRTSSDGANWSGWSLPVTASGSDISSPPGRFAQYQANLATSDPLVSPVVEMVSIQMSAQPPTDATPPVISSLTVTNVTDSEATISWTTDEPATTSVAYGLTSALGQVYLNSDLVLQHSVGLTGLLPNATYYFQASSADVLGNSSSAPVASFETAPGRWVQTAAADFSSGTLTNVAVSEDTGGELRLAPVLQDSFTGSGLESGTWGSGLWSSSGSVAVANGALGVNGSWVRSAGSFSAVTLEASVTMGSAPYQHFGFATDLNGGASTAWALFSTYNTTNTLFARTLVNNTEIRTSLPGSFVGSPHTYRIAWESGKITYYIDGVVVATHSVAIGGPMFLYLSEFNAGGPALTADWARVQTYPNGSGTFVSSTFDAGTAMTYLDLNWEGDTPAGTALEFRTRTSSDGSTWSAWSDPVATSGGPITSPSGRYIQYQVTLTSADPRATSLVSSVTIRFGAPTGP